MAKPGQRDPRGNSVADLLSRNLGPFQSFGRKIGGVLIVVIAVAVVSRGFFVVGPGEVGVVRTFGKHSGQAGPGPHFKIPLVQDVDVVNLETVRRIEVGLGGDKATQEHEAQMLTGDENIVEAQVIVQYRVTDAAKYLFELRDPEEALRATAEVALRSMVGRTKIDDVITTGRESVQSETRDWMQKLMNEYQSGITISEVKLQTVDAPDEVKEAFHDVVRAREEKEKLINQAKGYQADLIPRARGQARQIEREAEAYREERVLKARGDAAKFDSQLTEYRKAAGVTRKRLHIETMERILAKVDKKTVLADSVARSALPLLGPIPAGGSEKK